MAEEKVSMPIALRGAQESLAKGQYQEVVKLCKIVLKQDRNNYDGYVLLGSALFQLKQYAPAEKALRLAVGVNASKMAAWQRLTELYETTGNTKELVDVCRATRERAQALKKTEVYLEYTRKLVVALSANSCYGQACIVWQEVIDCSSFPEAILSEGIRGLADSKSLLLEKTIQEEYKKRLSEHDKASLSSTQCKEELSSTDCSTSTYTEDILLLVEEDFADSELSNELEILLRNIISQADTQSEHQHQLLLRLLLRRTRAARHNAGKDWKIAKSQALRQCVVMILSHGALTAFEVASKFLEDDDGDEMLRSLKIGNENWKQSTEAVFLSFGRVFAHMYPGHGLALAALACGMDCGSSHVSSLERQRLFCEKALRLEDNCATGWQVLANVHMKQGSYTSATECVRRGLQAVSKSRAMYGVSLGVAEMQLQLTLGQTHLGSQRYAEAESTFQYVAEEAKALTSTEEQSLIAAANEGLAKVALARGEVELAGEMLALVISLNAHNHWAFAEQGWLAFQKGDQKEAVKYLEQAVALQPCDASYHRRLGLLYWKAGGDGGNLKDKALPQFLEAVKLDPSQSDVFRYLGHYYRDRAGDMPRAVRCYQKSVTLNPEDDEAGEALCDLLDSEGQEVLEVDICQGASQRSRRAYWAWRRLGFLQVGRKEWSKAVPNLQHALRGYVTDADLWEALGLAYQHLGMLTAALKAYGRATTLGSSSPVFSLMQSGNILLLLASYRKAINLFQEALEKVPKHVGALCGLGAAMLGRARECIMMGAFSWSATLAKDAVELLSESVTDCSNVGAFWKLLGDLEVTYAQALPFEIMDSVDFSSFDFKEESLHGLRAAIDLWNQTRVTTLEKAIQSYKRALHLCPSQGSLYSDLGIAFDLISSLERSKTDSKSTWLPAVTTVCGGLRLDGDKPDLWVTLGMLTKHKGLRQHSFIQALRIDGAHALAWGGLGQLYIGEGNEELARDAFDCARCANPALPLPWAGMAYVHSCIESEKDIQEAYASCLYAVQLSPSVEVQLGLGKLAARTHQLQDAEVYTAVEQAVQHAPHRAEAHNLRGLSCESRGDSEGAIKAFLLARYALAVQSSATKGPSLLEYGAVSLNLARVLCKAGATGAAVREYEKLEDLGLLQEDAGGLRGYAVALWDFGSPDKAASFAKKSVDVDLKAGNMVGGQALVTKMIYWTLGPSYALEGIRNAPKDSLTNARFFLNSLAVAVVCANEHVINNLMSGYCASFGHDTSIEAHLLAAAGKQLIAGILNFKPAIHQLQKALHLYPQSYSLRARLGEILLESSSGDNAHLVSQCCGILPSHVQHSIHYGSLCSTLAAAACACGHIGGLNFSSCHGSFPNAILLTRHLQRWVHKEPWNIKARYHLVLSFLQQARAQKYPLNLCHTIQRMAVTGLSMLPTSTHLDLSFQENIRLLLLVAISECGMHIGDFDDAILVAKSATKFKLSLDGAVFAILQLGRCYAALQDYKSLQVELSNARSVLTSDNTLGWLALIELEQLCGVQDSPSLDDYRKSISDRDVAEQNKWMGWLHLVRANGFIWANDLWSAQKVAAEASALTPENYVCHLLHGALCLELALRGSNYELLTTAVRSLTKAVLGSSEAAIPLTSLLLCQAQPGKGRSKNTDLSKWERKLWTEWSAWPPESRPAELYFQMGVLVKKAQGTLTGTVGTSEASWNTRWWLQRAVHLRPDSVSYQTSLRD